MKYNEFKKYASSLGVKCTGTRDEIMERVLNALADENIGGAEESATKTNVDSSKVESVIDECEKELEEESKVKGIADEYIEKAKEVIEEMGESDVIEALEEAGMPTTSDNCLVNLATALRDGVIELEDEEDTIDEEEKVEEKPAKKAEVKDNDDTHYTEEYDPNGFNYPDNMTAERKEAVVSLVADILNLRNSGKLNDDDITSFVEDFTTSEDIELLGDSYTIEDVFNLYIELRKAMVDDEGNANEPSNPYEVNESDFCCGHELKYDSKHKTYICEVCGSEYEAE